MRYVLIKSLFFAHHHPDKVIKVKFTVVVGVTSLDNLGTLLLCQVFADLPHHKKELLLRDVAVAVSVKHFESLHHLLLCVGIAHSAPHKLQELAEFNAAAIVTVDLGNHLAKLRLRALLAQRAEHVAEFVMVDRAVVVFVEQLERLSNLLHEILRYVIHGLSP